MTRWTEGYVIEHDCWRGVKNESKPGRIAIVGYSHHRSPENPDYPGFTQEIMRAVISGDQRGDSFFTSVAHFFGYIDRAAFWEDKLFFNFIPECIGTTEEKYKTTRKDQHEAGQARFLRIIRAELPTKIFVFSTKAWRWCPPTIQETHGEPCTRLGVDYGNASYGRYELCDRTAIAIGFRHPQFATQHK